MVENLTDDIITDSWISATGNGSSSQNNIAPTPVQKTWIAILLGFIFFILACPIIDKILKKDLVITLKDIIISILKTIIFVVIIRLIMW